MSQSSDAKPNRSDKPADLNEDIETGTMNDGPENLDKISNRDGSQAEKVQSGSKSVEEKPKPSKIKAAWGNLGLDMGTVLMMFK